MPWYGNVAFHLCNDTLQICFATLQFWNIHFVMWTKCNAANSQATLHCAQATLHLHLSYFFFQLFHIGAEGTRNMDGATPILITIFTRRWGTYYVWTTKHTWLECYILLKDRTSKPLTFPSCKYCEVFKWIKSRLFVYKPINMIRCLKHV